MNTPWTGDDACWPERPCAKCQRIFSPLQRKEVYCRDCRRDYSRHYKRRQRLARYGKVGVAGRCIVFHDVAHQKDRESQKRLYHMRKVQQRLVL
jgi:hypothetical protein